MLIAAPPPTLLADLIPAGGPEQKSVGEQAPTHPPHVCCEPATATRAFSRSSAPRLRQEGRCAGREWLSGTLDDAIAK